MASSLEKMVLGAVTLVSLSGCQNLSEDTGEEVDVVLYPNNPSVEDDLHCRVDRSQDYTFDFYWQVNRTYVSLDERSPAGYLTNIFFQSGDYVECSAWVPASPWYDSFEIGRSGVYIGD